MNFIVFEVTYLRYFIPLIIEGNKRKIKSKVFLRPTPAKYNCPEKWKERIKELSAEYAFETLPVSKISTEPGLTFLLEGRGIEYLNSSHHKVSLTSMLDFCCLYSKYIDKVDSVIFISEFLAKHYNQISEKNLYLGSPKYDVVLDKDAIIKKFKLDPNKRNVLILGPPTRTLFGAGSNLFGQTFPYLDKDKINNTYNDLHEILKEHNFIYKTRGKDPLVGNPYSKNMNNKFEDSFWFPHDSMQLTYVSDFVVCFDTSAIKEITMMEKPLLNFRITDTTAILGNKLGNKARGFDFLYQYNHCLDRPLSLSRKELEEDIDHLLTSEFDFTKAKQKHLRLKEGSSKDILNAL